MKVANETQREYSVHSVYGRLLFRCICECGYQTMWYPHKDCAERQMEYHAEYHAEQSHKTVPEVASAV